MHGRMELPSETNHLLGYLYSPLDSYCGDRYSLTYQSRLGFFCLINNIALKNNCGEFILSVSGTIQR